jgi:GNAT superfamily N-acetyltransferase
LIRSVRSSLMRGGRLLFGARRVCVDRGSMARQAAKFSVHRAEPSDFERVGRLSFALLDELYPALGYERGAFVEAAKALLGGGAGVWAFLAVTPDRGDVGLITLNECAAVYAGGRFGEISELYVVPELRSSGVGTALVDAAIAFARARGWPNLEVGAPSVPEWQRTVDFYRRRGFVEVGPRLDLRLKRAE